MSTSQTSDRSQYPDRFKWDAGIEKVFPVEDRRAKRALVVATIIRLHIFCDENPLNASDEEINSIAVSLAPARLALFDLLVHEQIVFVCDMYSKAVGDFIARNKALLARWSQADARAVEAFRRINPSQLERLPAVQDILNKPEEMLQSSSLLSTAATAAAQALTCQGRIAVATEQACAWVGITASWEQSQVLVAGSGQQPAPQDNLAQQIAALEQAAWAGYNQYQSVFVEAMRQAAVTQIASARAQGVTLRQSIASRYGVPETLFGHWSQVVRQNLTLFWRFLDWNRRHFKHDQIPIMHLTTGVGLGSTPVSFQQAFEHTIAACAPLGDKYVNVLQELHTGHYIDYCPNPGRNPTARMIVLREHPFLFFNYTGAYEDRRQVAHEVSHAAHFILAKYPGQRTLQQSPFVLETVAAVGECLHCRHVLKVTSQQPREHAILLAEEIWRNMLRIFIDTLWAEFELSAHEYMEEGGILDWAWLCTQFAALLREYCGPLQIVNLDKMAVMWPCKHDIYIGPHMLCVYPPTSAIAWGLTDNMLKDGGSAVEDYLAFLHLNYSVSTPEALSTLGVDLNSDQIFQSAFRQLGELMTSLEATRF